ncbi:MAG: zinc ABC transporter substrate-binding protein, partial [Proteobacteria bacterium]|nr:zinc ABC transporter substrate-binding protein [Pseudomonadota bacterium]
QAEPHVVASVLPVHSLIAGVMQGVGTPTLLLKGGASPHTYALKPSDARGLQNADAIFWVGEALETFLAKALHSLPHHAKIVTLADVPAMQMLDARHGGVWADDGQPERPVAAADGDGHHHSAHPDHTTRDLHIWLDPANAATIVHVAVAALSQIDAANAATYRANGRVVLQRLEHLEKRIRDRLAGVHKRPYLVFHDAYQYFEARFATNAVGTIAVSPDRPPGAKRLAELRRRLDALDAACVFAEPQFRPAIVAIVARGTGARTAVLDPLGIGLTPGPDAYFQLLDGIAQSLRNCLAASP